MLGGFDSIANLNDGKTVANVGVRRDNYNGDLYLSALATTDELTANIAQARGFRYDESTVCTINGKPGYVFIMLRRSERV